MLFSFFSHMRTKLIQFLTLTAAGLAQAQDPCGEWSVVPSPDPLGSQRAIIRDLTAIAPNDVWAVGEYTTVEAGQIVNLAFSMHWDGSHWSLVPTPNPSPYPGGTNVGLWAVDATGPNDVWAAGNQSIQAPDGFVGTHILIMHWNGSAWTVLNTPVQTGASGDLVWGVTAIAPNDVWFFGEGFYSGTPTLSDPALALHWNGSSFQFTSVPRVNSQTSGFGDGNGLRAGSALSASDIWAVGAASDGDSLASELSQIHHWNGSAWTHVPAGPVPGTFHDLNAVVAVAPDDVWAAGEYFDGDFHGLSLHWDGVTWTQFPIPIGVEDMYAFGSDDVYAVGGGVAHWDGSNWTVVDTPPGVAPSLHGVDSVGPCELWAGGAQVQDELIRTLTIRLEPNRLAGDVDGDGDVDLMDLASLLSTFGACTGDASFNGNADFDRSGCIELADLTVLLAGFGL